MGIADSVTVLARNAAEADAAATIIGNGVDLPGHSAVTRAPANQIKDDTDLLNHLVVTGCAPLTSAETAAALEAGVKVAERLKADGMIHRAALFLEAQGRVVADGEHIIPDLLETRHYA
jgi:hypothetical protein